MNQDTLKNKLKLVQLDIEGWRKFNKDKFGQYPHSGKAYFCEPCKVYNNNGKCRISEFDKCPYYEFSEKKCVYRDSYKNWVKHHEVEHHNDELRFKSCDVCQKYWEAELLFYEDAERYLKNKISNAPNLQEARDYLKSRL